MKNTRKGFTLVELLAVIVILAIIMIIAIPSVLGTMTTARQKSFCEYVTKVYMAAENKFMSAQTLGDGYVIGNQSATNVPYTDAAGAAKTSAGFYYDVKTDLGLENVGDYSGYVMIVKPTTNDTKPHFVVVLWDSNYMLTSNSGSNYYYEYVKEPTSTNLIDTDSAVASRITKLFVNADAKVAVDASKLTKTTLPALA